MFGILFGTACLVGLWWVVKRGGGWGVGRRVALRRVFERLDATPGQEKVIREAVDDLVNAARAAGKDARGWREDLAAAVRKDYFDETLLGELFAKQDGTIETLRKEIVGSLGRVHSVLDDRQRDRLGDVLEQGWGRGFRGHYRACA